MKALSIRQPWPWGIFHGGKPVENRSWKTSSPHLRIARGLVGQEILIHASKGMTVDEFEDGRATIAACCGIRIDVMPTMDALPRGGIVGRARLVGIITDDVPAHALVTPELRAARVSPYFFGPVGLVLADAKPCNIIPFTGSLGFFDVPDSIAREALAA